MRIMLVVLLLAWVVRAGDPPPRFDVGEERRIPTSWNPPQFVYANGKLVGYTPSTPNFETFHLGMSLGVQSVAVTREAALGPILPQTWVKDSEGKLIPVEYRRTVKINGEFYKAVGQADGVVYLKHLKTGKYFTMPIAPAPGAEAPKDGAEAPKAEGNAAGNGADAHDTISLDLHLQQTAAD